MARRIAETIAALAILLVIATGVTIGFYCHPVVQWLDPNAAHHCPIK